MEYKSFAVKNAIPSEFLSLPLPKSIRKKKKRKFRECPCPEVYIEASNLIDGLQLNSDFSNANSQKISESLIEKSYSMNASKSLEEESQTTNNPRKRRRKCEPHPLKNDVWTFVFNNVSQMKFNLSPSDTCYANPKKVSNLKQNYDLNSIRSSRICQSFNEEIRALAFENGISNNKMALTVSTIIFDLEQTLNRKIPYRSFEVFGSYGNGLCCRESDLDFCCRLPPMDDSSLTATMNRVRKLLSMCPKFRDVIVIRHARIPIIKLIHVKTNKECDVSFRNPMGVSNTVLMKSVMNIYPNIRILTLYLKHLLRKYNLHGPHKITTYILFWLTVYFLQAKFGFESIEKLRSSRVPVFHDNGWNISPLVIDNNFKKPEFEGQLYVLFYEFLDFYANYDFLKFVICPYLGIEIDIREFNNFNIPQGFEIYVKKIDDLEIPSFSYSTVNIQDPTEHNYNLGRPVDISSINQFKQFCYHLHKILPAPASESWNNYVLSNILPPKLPTQVYPPKMLDQYAAIFLHSSMISLDQSDPLMSDFSRVVDSIRKMMEVIFEFELTSPVIEENSKRNVFVRDERERVEVPVAYLSYSTTAKTWWNENMLKVFSNIELRDDWNFEVFIFCEGRPNGKGVSVSLQNENHFNNFLKNYTIKLLQFILKSTDK